ncbi:class I tRNA ligase family protein [Corallococcus llansteffanensis]|uniref:Methionyl/Leucyl tRNA synthetase domain-containing protein n=1 Tax=Corallococcus llansteffanensis TaxID=2316731 RepID=A0A3A8QKK1_9BACT|nr:class I tRNA ligase family protein [Corallococcus llansteffanensis]RKH68301.1 hypothetical protein D7V93_01665 [Corallococcus llansteffanensis]
MSRMTLIIAPPPTPNGDLHVGHMSGPYLAADIYKRYIGQHGRTARYTVSTDDNQSYVDTTARRLKTDVPSLLAKSRAEVRDSLLTYSIGVDHFGEQDAAYPGFVTAFFEKLLAAGFVENADVEVFYDTKRHTYPVEAYISGRCPTCLDSTCGGICEACGHPNACTDLLEVNTPDLEVRREARLIFRLEPFRAELEEHLLRVMKTHRPALKALIASMLASPLAPFVLSYKTGRGISAGFAGLPDQQLNVWAEMYPGHFYFLTKAAGKVQGDDDYVQAMGFDNSYFYVFVHVALALAGRRCGVDWPLPKAFITNQFYNLDSAKFSTSKGHLVWARDLAREYNTDVIRLYLALHGPEFQEANFSLGAFKEGAAELTGRVNGLVAAFNTARKTAREGVGDGGMLARLNAVLSTELPAGDYAASTLARRALNGIALMKDSLDKGYLGLVPFVPALLALALEPFCPLYAQAIRRQHRLTAETWNDLAPTSEDQALPELLVKK